MADIEAQIQLLIDLANAQAAAATAQQAAAAAAAIAPAAVPPVVAAAVPPGIGAVAAPVLYPGHALTVPLDYTQAEDRKIFKAATTPLSPQFGLTSADLQIFLEKVKTRAQIHNWTDIFKIPDDDGTQRDLLQHYGLLSLENVVAAANAYVDPPTRTEQNSIMAFLFLQDSLTDDARNMIMASPEAYTINGNPSGPCLLKIIIGKSTVDTYSTISVLRDYVGALDDKMVELNSDIKLFNLYVVQLRNALVARGQDIPELMMNVFKGYSRTADEDFVRYIQNKRDDHEDGSHRLTLEALMTLAINRYDLKVQNKTWSVADTKDTRIIALEAAIAQMVEHGVFNSIKTPPQSPKPKVNRSDDAKFAWKLIPPGPNDKQVRKWNKKTYFWCQFHKAWTIHEPGACHLKNKETSKPASEPTPPAPASSTYEKQKLFLSQALQAITEMEESED